MAVLPANLLEILLMMVASVLPGFASASTLAALFASLRAAQRTLLWWRDLHLF
jgi:hypothetical protein